MDDRAHGTGSRSEDRIAQQATPGPWGFGVAQSGTDIPATVSFNSFDGTITGLFQTPLALFAGESPIYMGLDQVNAYFPMCVANAKAIVEKRYDAFMDFTSIQTATHARVYLPFLVRMKNGPLFGLSPRLFAYAPLR